MGGEESAGPGFTHPPEARQRRTQGPKILQEDDFPLEVLPAKCHSGVQAEQTIFRTVQSELSTCGAF